MGEYENFKELTQPASYQFTAYPRVDFDPNFNSRSLRSNAVLRWEYRPGSALFLVWSQSRSAFSNDTRFRPWRSIGDSFSDEGANIFLLKISYWVNM